MQDLQRGLHQLSSELCPQFYLSDLSLAQVAREGVPALLLPQGEQHTGSLLTLK
ncbi:hypothetical protein HispidOSU_000594 [Sigmodon hispidus]